MRRIKKHEQKAEINVVPYIDVSLVLLIVFMVTAPLLMQGVDVQLPQASTQPLNADDEPLIISVKQDKTYYINLGSDQEQQQAIPLTALGDKVRAIVASNSANNKKKPVLVWGDARVEYGAVVDAMATLQQAGVAEVGLVTDPPTNKPK